MKIFSIYILNKAGGLIYQNDLNPGLSKLSANDYLVLAGTLHGVHVIATRLRPEGTKHTLEEPSVINSAIIASGKALLPNANRLGLQNIDTDFFSLYVFQTVTGIKFVIVTSPANTTDINPAVPNSGQGELNKQLEQVSKLFEQFYVFYCDYVMKDPFYSMDMPIKSAMFEAKVKSLAN